ncbi:MAG TPA: thioredoxin domain-containing protein, partial [Chthonomonadales bacterium]|nr:thioredoxin domain-containing protein [Chthonomonadales bacterium]
MSEVEGTSLRLALIDLTLSGVKRTLRYWVTPDGREIIDGRVSALDGDPWISTRSLLDLNRAPSKGSSAAPVTIVEFTDLQCPYCAQSHATIRRLQQSAPDRIRVVFKHFPLTDIHPWAMEAAVA